MMGTQNNVQAQDINTMASPITQNNHTSVFHTESKQMFQEGSQGLMDVDSGYGAPGYGPVGGTFIRHTYSDTKASLYEEIALPDAFLDDYYSQ
ncbi:hypothetical protein LDENG_00165510, partial [Lucifuga dentata]